MSEKGKLRIKSVEPIEGTIIDYFKNSNRDGVIIPTFDKEEDLKEKEDE